MCNKYKNSVIKNLFFIQIFILITIIFCFMYFTGTEFKLVSCDDYYLPNAKNPPTRNNIGTNSLGPVSKLWKFKESPVAKTDMSHWSLSQGGFMDGLASSASWAFVAYGVASLVSSAFFSEEKKARAFENAVGLGTFAGTSLSNLGWVKSSAGAGWVGLGVGAAVYILSYKDTETEIFSVTCSPYTAPFGGRNCQKCNKQDLPCSEYQCKSLGSGCEIINKGTDEQRCVWVERDDVSFPVIKPWVNVLLKDYRYTPDNAISPPDRGVKILNDATPLKCVKAFTPLRFGIKLDEPAWCKIDFNRTSDFESMKWDFGNSKYYRYNHTQVMVMPGSDEDQPLIPTKAGEYELYVRCQDKNKNYNKANFVFKFCVEKGPDATPPLIVATNLINQAPIQFNQSSADFETYTNEPAECRWSKSNIVYNDMKNYMTCVNSASEFNTQMLYTCKTNLTGLRNNAPNNFYIRCIDHPELKGTEKENDRNENTEGYKFTLIGTIPLVIYEVSPNKTIKGDSNSIKVTLEAETHAGYNEGEAFCYYSETGKNNTYILFYNTNSYTHSQDLFLPQGDYTYHIKCIDLGGNFDTATTTFSLKSDIEPPKISFVYKEENSLKIITNEEADCVYDNTDCNYLFDDATTMTTTDSENHFTEWKSGKTFYIKCRDKFGNMPRPDECSGEFKSD
jgi:hypothetical protein